MTDGDKDETVPGAIAGAGPGNTGGTGTGIGSGPTGGEGPSIAGGPATPGGGDESVGSGASVDDVAREAGEEEDAAVDLGSELSFPASDPPAYMGAGAITGPPVRDEEHPQQPVISPEHEAQNDPRELAPEKAAHGPEGVAGERDRKHDPSEAAAGSEVGGDLDEEG